MLKVFHLPSEPAPAPAASDAPMQVGRLDSGRVRPDAAGNLSDAPFAHVLVALLRRGATGALVLWPEDIAGREHRVQFERGVPTAVDLGRPAVRIQDAIITLFASGRQYSFYENMPLTESPTLLRGVVDPLPLLVHGVRAHAREEVVDQWLARVGERPLHLAPRIRLERLKLQPEEETIADVLRHGAAPASTLIATSFLPLDEARRLVYLLLLLGAIRPGGAGDN